MGLLTSGQSSVAMAYKTSSPVLRQPGFEIDARSVGCGRVCRDSTEFHLGLLSEPHHTASAVGARRGISRARFQIFCPVDGRVSHRAELRRQSFALLIEIVCRSKEWES